MILRRRSLLLGLLAAPAIVRASSLMSIVPIPENPWGAFVGALPSARLLPEGRVLSLGEMLANNWKDAVARSGEEWVPELSVALPKTVSGQIVAIQYEPWRKIT
jgi:hypothetical protein